VETLAQQRPGALEQMVERGVLQRSPDGQYLADAGLLARANELLADGTRVRALYDIADAAATGAEQVGDRLLTLAREAGSRDATTWLDFATWTFREALRARLRPAT
jgi:hypothetical protein